MGVELQLLLAVLVLLLSQEELDASLIDLLYEIVHIWVLKSELPVVAVVELAVLLAGYLEQRDQHPVLLAQVFDGSSGVQDEHRVKEGGHVLEADIYEGLLGGTDMIPVLVLELLVQLEQLQEVEESLEVLF